MKRLFITLLIFSATALAASENVRIARIDGDVKIRRGLDENWQIARTGMELDPLDTILTGEKSEVRLDLPENMEFRLGANAILDIADLRPISKRELFLIIMSEKIEKLPPRGGDGRLHISNVNVVHGAKRDIKDDDAPVSQIELEWLQNRNGGVDLYEQQFHTNAIIKFHKMLKKYTRVRDCGEVFFYLGKTFEALQNEGQALEAYTSSLQNIKDEVCEDPVSLERRDHAEEAIHKLKK